MKPVLDTIKSDKLINSNFEEIQNVLCGNVSLDNMSLRILEGVTGSTVDAQNLMIHSGNTRPVGWLPLVGDVYVQEINDKYIDIRSTKPQVKYKVLILFGPAITDSALKEVGGPDYQDTTEVATEQAIEQIQLIQQPIIQYKPLVTKSYTLPNPCIAAGPPTNTYKKVLAGVNHFYVIVGGPAAQQKMLFRIDRETGVVDYIDFTSTIGTNYLSTMIQDGSDIVVLTSYSKYVFLVDTDTFTITRTYDPVVDQRIPYDMYVDNSYIFFTAKSINGKNAYLYRLKKLDGVVDVVALSTYDGTHLFTPYAIMRTPSYPAVTGINEKLWVVVENDDSTCFRVYGVEIYKWDVLMPTPLLNVTDILTHTSAMSAITGIAVGYDLYIPVIYSAAHQALGGTVNYLSGIAKIETINGCNTTIIPVNVPFMYGQSFLDTIVEEKGYLYSLAAAAGVGTLVIRYDTLTGTAVNGFISLAITISPPTLKTYTCIDTDSTLLYIRNPGMSPIGAADYGNFEFATVDFSDYNTL